MMVDSIIYYFGCWNEPGHYLHSKEGRVSYRDENVRSWGSALDGGIFLPSGPQMEGRYRLTHIRMETAYQYWTVIGWWDRSVDSRPGSCSAFLARETLSADEILALAHQDFPQVFSRMKFELKPERCLDG